MLPPPPMSVRDALLQVNVPMGHESWLTTTTTSYEPAAARSSSRRRRRRRPMLFHHQELEPVPSKLLRPRSAPTPVLVRYPWSHHHHHHKIIPEAPRSCRPQFALEPWSARSARARRKRERAEAARLERAIEVLGRPEARAARRARLSLQRLLLETVAIGRIAAVLRREIERDRSRAWTERPTPASFVSLVPKKRPRRRAVYVNAATNIQRWYAARKVSRVFAARTWVPRALEPFARAAGTRCRRKQRERSVVVIVKFLDAGRRSARFAVHRLARAVRRVQNTIRASSRCRLARLGLLEKAFVREERARRDRLVEDRRRDQRLALERTKTDPVFGPRAARLFDASAKLRALLSLEGTSRLARRLRLRTTKLYAAKPPSQLRDDDDDDDDDNNTLHTRSPSLCVDSIYAPFPAPHRRAFLDALLCAQRRLYRERIEDRRIEARHFRAGVDDVKRLFFGEQPTTDFLVCVPPELGLYDPFLLLTPPDGALSEIRRFVHGSFAAADTVRTRPSSSSRISPS